MSRDLGTDLLTTGAELGLTWFGQSAALLGVGLLAGRAVRSRGPAVQSAVYRTTLAAVLVCPVASALLAGAGVAGVRLRLPGGVTAAVVVVGAAPEPFVTVVPDPTPPRSPIPDRRPAPDAGERQLAPAASSVGAEPPAPVASDPLPPPDRAVPVRRLTFVLTLGLAIWVGGAAGLGLRLVLAAGRYTITYPRPAPGPDGQSFYATGFIETFAQAPGFGPSPFIDGRIGPLVPDDVPITGRLVDLEGNPVAGPPSGSAGSTCRGPIGPPRPNPPRAGSTRRGGPMSDLARGATT